MKAFQFGSICFHCCNFCVSSSLCFHSKMRRVQKKPFSRRNFYVELKKGGQSFNNLNLCLSAFFFCDFGWHVSVCICVKNDIIFSVATIRTSNNFTRWMNGGRNAFPENQNELTNEKQQRKAYEVFARNTEKVLNAFTWPNNWAYVNKTINDDNSKYSKWIRTMHRQSEKKSKCGIWFWPKMCNRENERKAFCSLSEKIVRFVQWSFSHKSNTNGSKVEICAERSTRK